jgi:histidinol-phosphate aminotransferase
MTNRRNWLKTTLALTAGLPLGASLAERLMAAPMSEAEKIFFASKPFAPAKIRLDSNENPYGPSEKVREAIIKMLTETNRYPFQATRDFKEVLALKEGVTADHIAVGAGSADLLSATGAAFSLEGGRILSGFPTFPMLMGYAEVFKATWDKVNVNDALKYDYEALASQIKSDTRLVFVCNPNNPTGTLVDPAIVKAFCEEVSKKVPVFSDEAYLEFLEPSQQVSMAELVKRGENVIVSRTFSKVFGIAGLRVGYLVGKPDLIRKIARNQPGIPNNQIGLAAARVCLSDNAFVEMSRKKNSEARKHLTEYLDKKGYVFGKSETNFVMFDPKADGLQTLNKLAERGIAIRVVDFKEKQWLRVSIGTLEEMKVFTKTFDEVNS